MNAFPIQIGRDRDRPLFLRGRAVKGPLHLLPRHENGLTFAFGFALSTVPRLLDHLLVRVGAQRRSRSNALRIVLQGRSEREREVYLIQWEQPQLLVDITETMDLKLKAITSHASQVRDFGALEARLRRRFAALGAENGYDYAEGFDRIVLPG